MATTAVSVIEQRISEQIGDWLEVIVTTAINADNSIVSTNLTSFDSGRDDYFNDWWVYITDKANAGVNRQVSDYTSASGTLTIRGTALSDDSANLATIRLHRHNRDKYIIAMNDTIREEGSDLFQYLDFYELVTGNILPNSHFRDWTASTVPDKYALSNVTAAAETGAGNYRGGAKSAKVTATAGNGYMYITSDSYPQLLDLMNKSVNLYCWANPEDANDAAVVIYTRQADGTAQTLTSTTSAPAGEFTLLELENQNLNDDLVEVQIRFKVTTNTKFVYFDHARLIGSNSVEYLLPIDFRDGTLTGVQIQTAGYSEKFVDDLKPEGWTERLQGWEITKDGTSDQYLRLPFFYTTPRLIRLAGYKKLSSVSAYTDTIEIGDENLNLFIAYAKYKLHLAIEGPTSSVDILRYERESAKAYGEYLRLRDRLRLPKPKTKMKMWVY